jgi:hypothetical protein
MAMEHSDSPPVMDRLMDQKADIQQQIAAEYARRFDESGEDYMRSVEDVIRLNRDLFPMLGKYYTDAVATANPA